MSFIVISVQGSEDCVTRFYVNKKQCVTARTNQMMHVDNIIYHKKHRHVNIVLFLLKGQCHEKVYFIFFPVSVSPKPRNWVSPWGCFFFSKIPRDFLSSRCTPVSFTPWQMEKIFNFFLKFTLRCQQSATVSSFCHRWQIYWRCRWYLIPVPGATWLANISTSFRKKSKWP